MDELKIIIDTREQKPWEFPGHTTAVQKLDTGDYSVEGLEDVLCIERKQNTSEFAKNIIEKRYDDWTERMSKFKYKFLLLEFSLSDVELSMLHNIHVLFCDSSYTASKFAETIMYKVYSNERKQ
jgi:ERCC4-type nuclease